MRSTGFFRVLAGIVVAILLVGLGVGIYQAGLTAGAAGAAGTGAAAGVPYAYGFHGWGWGWGWGFGFFGILWFLFVIFLLVGLVRFASASRLGRRGGPRGNGHGWGDPTWMDERNRRIADFHRRLHEERDAGAGPDAAANRGSGGNG